MCEEEEEEEEEEGGLSLRECSELAILIQVKRSGAVQTRVWGGEKRRMQLT